jgi:hypothetical protein
LDARVKRFRAEASRSGVGRVGKRYSAELRALAVAVAQERSDEPLPLGQIAADLGVSPLSCSAGLSQGSLPAFDLSR